MEPSESRRGVVETAAEGDHVVGAARVRVEAVREEDVDALGGRIHEDGAAREAGVAEAVSRDEVARALHGFRESPA